MSCDDMVVVISGRICKLLSSNGWEIKGNSRVLYEIDVRHVIQAYKYFGNDLVYWTCIALRLDRVIITIAGFNTSEGSKQLHCDTDYNLGLELEYCDPDFFIKIAETLQKQAIE